jgi:hypothetical protein
METKPTTQVVVCISACKIRRVQEALIEQIKKKYYECMAERRYADGGGWVTFVLL